MKFKAAYTLSLFSLIFCIVAANPHNGEHHGGDDIGMNMDTSLNNPSLINDQDSNSTKIIPTPYAMAHTHGQPILQQAGLTPAQKLYWQNYNTTTFLNNEKGNRFALKFHSISLGFVSIFLYPICLMLNNGDANWYLPTLTLNFALTLASLFFLVIFASTFPDDLYPNNLYRPTSIILLVIVCLHYISAIVYSALNWMSKDYIHVSSDANDVSIPLQEYNSPSADSTLSSANTSDIHNSNLNNDTITDNYKENRNKTNLNENFDIEGQDFGSNFVTNLRNKNFKGQNSNCNKALDKVLNQPVIQLLCIKFGSVFKVIFNVLNYPLFVYYLFYACTGLAVGNLFGKEQRIFNLLAHWIKGGVFILLGFVSLARYCGFGQKRGWAWNRIIIYKRDVTQENSKFFDLIPIPKSTITMEGLESFLIFFYGSTNVFLEHLAGAGGAWTAKDLQHVSIAFMFVGTGLCGLLTEWNLNERNFKSVINNANKHASEDEILQEDAVYACSNGYSPNPFPALTIFWTGILMSQHAQASAVSTTVHVQWGSLLSYGSFFRLFTFLLLYFVPNTDSEPSKPLTELITSFCMLSGGLIFMESTDQVIEAMEYRGYTPMFTFNISVGIVALIMAWEMIIFKWRDYIKSRKFFLSHS